MDKISSIKTLFIRIYNLNVCGPDSLKVPRRIEKTNLNASVMIIAEAMAPSQVRLSGVNYYFKDGTLGSTGKSLEKFLNKFGCSVDPNHKNCVYHTEIVHSFPGYVVKSDKPRIRRPSQKEIELSIHSGILEDEIRIIKPRLILLMGNTAYTTFYKSFLVLAVERTLSVEIERISNGGSMHKFERIPVIPIQHASGANPRFRGMAENRGLIKKIKGILE